MNLGFSANPEMTHNISMILTKSIKLDTLYLFEMEENKNVRDLMILLLQYWLNEKAEEDSYILKASVTIVSLFCQSPKLWQICKTSPLIARLLTLQKQPVSDQETKSLIIKIVTSLSKHSAPPPLEVPVNKSRYGDI